MNMRCKQCGEGFPTGQPFDLFELRRHKLVPADSENMTHADMIEDGGTFCSRKCLADYLKVGGDQSGVFDLKSLRKGL